MSNFINDIIYSGLILLLFSLLIYLCGNIIFNLIGRNEDNEYKAFFWKVSVGLISVIVIFALIQTRLLTMYLGVVISIIIYLYSYKISLLNFIQSLKIRLEKKGMIVYIGILIISLLGVHYLFYFDNRLFSHYDLAFYSNIGYALHKYGIETINAEAIQIGPINASIYHYFNEWSIALFLGFSKYTSLKVFLLLVLPAQLAVIGSGAYYLASFFLKKNSKLNLFIISLFIIFFPGIISYLLNILLTGSFNTLYSILHSGILNLKTKIITILLLLFLIDFRKNIKGNNYLSLSLIPLFWNSLIPAFLGGYLLYFIYNIYNKKKIYKNLFLQLLIPIVYIPIHLIIINITTFSDKVVTNPQKDYGLTNFLLDTYSDSTKLILTLLIWIIPLTILIFLIIGKFDFFFKKLKNKLSLFTDELKPIFIISLFITISAVVTHGILRDLFNSKQVLTNLFYPIFNICLFFSILFLFKKFPKLFYPIVISIITLIAINLFRDSSFGNKKINALSKKIKDLEPGNEKILFASDIESKEAFSLYQKPYAFLLMNNENYNPIQLNIIWPTEKMDAKMKWDYFYAVRNQTFYKYVNLNNSNNDINKAKVDFIKENKINFLLIDSNTMVNNAPYLSDLQIETKIIFEKDIYLLKFEF